MYLNPRYVLRFHRSQYSYVGGVVTWASGVTFHLSSSWKTTVENFRGFKKIDNINTAKGPFRHNATTAPLHSETHYFCLHRAQRWASSRCIRGTMTALSTAATTAQIPLCLKAPLVCRAQTPHDFNPGVHVPFETKCHRSLSKSKWRLRARTTDAKRYLVYLYKIRGLPRRAQMPKGTCLVCQNEMPEAMTRHRYLTTWDKNVLDMHFNCFQRLLTSILDKINP